MSSETSLSAGNDNKPGFGTKFKGLFRRKPSDTPSTPGADTPGAASDNKPGFGTKFKGLFRRTSSDTPSTPGADTPGAASDNKPGFGTKLKGFASGIVSKMRTELGDTGTSTKVDSSSASGCTNDNLFVIVYGFIIIAMYIITIIGISISFENYTKYTKDRKMDKKSEYYKDTIIYKFLTYIRGNNKLGGSNVPPMVDVLGKEKIPREYDYYHIHEAHKIMSANYALMTTLMSIIILHFIFYLVVKYIVKSNICEIDIKLYGKVFLIAFIPILITLISTTRLYDRSFKDVVNQLKKTNTSISDINRIIVNNITTNQRFLTALTSHDSLNVIDILNQQTNVQDLKQLLITQSIYTSIVNLIDNSSESIQSINRIFNDPNGKLSVDMVPYLKITLKIDNILNEYLQNKSLDPVFKRLFTNPNTRDNSINQLESSINTQLESILTEINAVNIDNNKEMIHSYMRASLIFNIFMFLLVVGVILSLVYTLAPPGLFQVIGEKVTVFAKQFGIPIVELIAIVMLIVTFTK